jgi:phage gpG-like protein
MGTIALTVGVDMTEGLEKCKPIVAEQVRLNFETAGTQEGGWPARQGNRGHRTLIESGALMAAATGEGPGHIERIENGNELVWGVTTGVQQGGIPGAAVHQYGATIRPVKAQFLAFEVDGKKIFAKEVTIPPRPYLVIGEEAKEKIADVLADALIEEIG